MYFALSFSPGLSTRCSESQEGRRTLLISAGWTCDSEGVARCIDREYSAETGELLQIRDRSKVSECRNTLLKAALTVVGRISHCLFVCLFVCCSPTGSG